MTTLNIQVGFQQANDGSGNLLGALSYIASQVFGTPTALYTYLYGLSDNPTATPYPIFISDTTARSYYDAQVGPVFVSAANGYTAVGFYTTYAVQSGDVMQVNANWGETNPMAPDFIIGVPTAVSSFTNDVGYVSSTSLSSYLSSYATSTALSSGLSGKFNSPSGSSSQYIAGNGSLITFPSIPTQVQSDWNETNSSNASFISNKPSIPTIKAYDGTTQRTNSFPIFFNGTTNSSGQVTINLTNDGTSTGTALFPNGPITKSLNFNVFSSSTLYNMVPTWSNSNKTITLQMYATGSTSVLINLLGGLTNVLGNPVAAPSGVSVNGSVYGY